MKYISALTFAVLSTISLAQDAVQPKAQSALEYCLVNPNHESCKRIKRIFKELSRSKVSRIWRLITGKGMFLPGDHLRHFLYMCSENIGKELNWDQAKIDEEFNKLCEEAYRIQNS